MMVYKIVDYNHNMKLTNNRSVKKILQDFLKDHVEKNEASTNEIKESNNSILLEITRMQNEFMVKMDEREKKSNDREKRAEVREKRSEDREVRADRVVRIEEMLKNKV